MSAKGRVRPVLFQPLPVVIELFSRVAISLVGPLSTPSFDGHRYIVTLIDFTTDFPEAMPLKDIDTLSVSEALLTIFARVGIPREISLLPSWWQSYTNYWEQNQPSPRLSTSAEIDGLSGMHGILKSAFRKLCSDKPKEWQRYLISSVFAFREIPNNPPGLSPLEFLYGRWSVTYGKTVRSRMMRDRPSVTPSSYGWNWLNAPSLLPNTRMWVSPGINLTLT